MSKTNEWRIGDVQSTAIHTEESANRINDTRVFGEA